MRKICLFAALLALLTGCKPAQGSADACVIGFYNVENLFDTVHDTDKNDLSFTPEGEYGWTADKYEKKLSNIASVIRAMADGNGAWHDLLGLAEVENDRVLEDLVAREEIAAAGYRIVHFESPDVRGIDCALLYRPDRFRVLETRTLPYDFASEGGIVFEKTPEEQAAFRTRDVLCVRGELDGDPFAVYVAHYPSRVGGKGSDLRCRASEIILKDVHEQEARHPGIRIVVMGDMNDNPEDESLTTWLQGRETIAETGEGDLFSPFLRMHKEGFGTEEYHGEWNIFDCIFVNRALADPADGGRRILPDEDGHYGHIFNPDFIVRQDGPYAGTPYRTFSGGRFIGGYSDHYPTYILIGK